MQSDNYLALLVTILTIAVIVSLLGMGYWLLNQFFGLFTQEPSKQKVTSPPKTSPKKEKVEQKAPSQVTTGETLEWVKEEYPDALIMGAQNIVKEYKAGRRNFQSVYPTAIGPYETYFKWTVLDGIDVSRAMLYRAPFDGTSLLDANLNGAYLEGASFRGAILRRANLSWADLNGADLSGADLTGANLSFATLNGADLTKAKLTGAIINPEQLENVHSLKGAVMPDGSKYA